MVFNRTSPLRWVFFYEDKMKIQTKYGEVNVLANCPLLDSTERLEWMTEVHESFDSTELRYPLRDAPRQVLSCSWRHTPFRNRVDDRGA